MYLAYSSHWVSNDCLFKDFQDNDCEFKVFPEDAKFTALYQLGKGYGKEKMNLFRLFSSGHMAGTNFSNLLKLTMAMWLHLTKKIQVVVICVTSGWKTARDNVWLAMFSSCAMVKRNIPDDVPSMSLSPKARASCRRSPTWKYKCIMVEKHSFAILTH